MNIQTTVVELLRPGPPHGQLLSPLTRYIALCEEHGPVTFQIQVEHWKLLTQLEMLRYYLPTGAGTVTRVENSQRQIALNDLGEMVRGILRDLVTVPAELGRAAGSESDLVHLRLIMSGSELALLPFELGIAPLGYPGEGVELLLQRRVPTILTREARRGRAMHLHWDRTPRVLFVSAAPAGTSVPAAQHLRAVREALEDWIPKADTPEARLAETKKLLTVINNATIGQIKDACASTAYTHVHILAHGASREELGNEQFGILLCAAPGSDDGEVVSGRRIAQALQHDLKEGKVARRPSVVTLATCDSGNIGSVVAPGASVAHELQAFGIPLVFASQFPLTKAGSVTLVKDLYTGLLRGDDPRVLLYNLRDKICVHGARDHDWASLVCYASLPEDFSDQVLWFMSGQTRRAIDVQLDWAERKREEPGTQGLDIAEAAIARARTLLSQWDAALPAHDEMGTAARQAFVRKARVEFFGVSGATEKRAAEIYHHLGREPESVRCLQASITWYKRAVTFDPTAHWPATQYLSLSAVLEQTREPDVLRATLEWAERGLGDDDAGEAAWAHGTMAELKMLRLYHDRIRSAAGRRAVAADVEKHCQSIVALVGRESFHVRSTRRQFNRYLRWWDNEALQGVAARAVAVFDGP